MSDAAGGEGRPRAGMAAGLGPKAPCNFVNPLLTDMYQVTMCYAYWKANKHNTEAVFELFFRKNPFSGEYVIFAGLSDVISLLDHYKFTAEHIQYLRAQMPSASPEFFDYLSSLDCSQVKVQALKEGTVVFPREPLIRLEGPVGICQLLETSLLCIVNFASLVATNAARMRQAAGPNKTLLEFGLRRAQGPDGGVSASRYCYIGGFDGTSNALAGMLFGMKVGGTHAHSFVQSFSSIEDLKTRMISLPGGAEEVDFVDIVLRVRAKFGWEHTNTGELASFICICQALPESFVALVDTYDTLVSGIPNFLICAVAMFEIGYQPIGIRLDSGDLAYLSLEARKMFEMVEKQCKVEGMAKALKIVASNDIGEDTLHSLNQQGHSIDTFGIGTHLVTCQNQPALGCVYKLVEFDKKPRIKLSQEIKKVSVPGKKVLYRLYGKAGYPLVDLMQLQDEEAPNPGERIMCRHPLDPTKRVVCVPAQVLRLHHVVWDGGPCLEMPSISEIRNVTIKELSELRHDHVRRLNPTPYKVSLSENLFKTMYELWRKEAPILELT
uniref:Nicotinate phosphoribosyltransferase n=1 Tax=Hemiselmis andersenii TaxID=464988 RepID=A0A6U2FYG9_HEMAN|mmetsp:Transcript_3447/g.7952  ORF Transcript_3447/g.7952 Transcript_3447/m.7952 type:complete len:552 (+) Transcript_3447:103-1758(+)